MATPFVIGAKEREQIQAAVSWARANALPLAVVKAGAFGPQETDTLRLADRPKDFKKLPATKRVMLPFGFRLEISGEHQPGGLCLHFSISAPDAVNRLPHPLAIEMIAEACGLEPRECLRTWLEEFEIDGKPAGKAVNCIYLMPLSILIERTIQ